MNSQSTTRTFKIFACDQQPIMLAGLQQVLDASGEFEFLGSAQNFADALDALRAHQPHLVLVDQYSELKFLFQFFSDARTLEPECHCVLWAHELAESDCLRALQAGARGILRRTAPVETVLECLRTVSHGEVWLESTLTQDADPFFNGRPTPRLTRREKEIVQLVCSGLKNKEIGESLSITPGTVKVHLMHIFEKTGAKDRFELAVHGRRLLGRQRSVEPDAPNPAKDALRPEAHPQDTLLGV
jgi:DNA-binding NarL/FixJ family response regulator